MHKSDSINKIYKKHTFWLFKRGLFLNQIDSFLWKYFL